MTMIKTIAARASPVVVPLLCLLLCGCDDQEAKRSEHLQDQLASAQEEIQRQNQRIEHLGQQVDRDRRVLEGQRKEAQSDASAAILLWASCGLSLAVVILLLARERFLRKILERVVGLLNGAQGRP